MSTFPASANQFRRRLHSNELETWNEKGKCLNYRLQCIAKNTTRQPLTFLPVPTNFFCGERLNRRMLSLDGLHLSVEGHRHFSMQILKFTKQIRVQASAEFTTEATKSTPKPRKYACKDAHKFETKAAPESTPFSCNYGSRFRILQDPSVRQYGGGSPQPESTVFSTVDPTSSIGEKQTSLEYHEAMTILENSQNYSVATSPAVKP